MVLVAWRWRAARRCHRAGGGSLRKWSDRPPSAGSLALWQLQGREDQKTTKGRKMRRMIPTVLASALALAACDSSGQSGAGDGRLEAESAVPLGRPARPRQRTWTARLWLCQRAGQCQRDCLLASGERAKSLGRARVTPILPAPLSPMRDRLRSFRGAGSCSRGYSRRTKRWKPSPWWTACRQLQSPSAREPRRSCRSALQGRRAARDHAPDFWRDI